MYKLTQLALSQTTPTSVIRIADNWSIPFDPANGDYQQYLAWLEAGNTPEPADEIA